MITTMMAPIVLFTMYNDNIFIIETTIKIIGLRQFSVDM
jgi:hypothetical protein